jgi:hypothetical protein
VDGEQRADVRHVFMFMCADLGRGAWSCTDGKSRQDASTKILQLEI